MNGAVVCKFGGELVEDARNRGMVADAVAGALRRHPRTPFVVVHGGGRDIDAALTSAGIAKRQVDGLRITDAATLDVVVAVLAGHVNTHLVAALNAAGVAAVGLTGADARLGLSVTAAPHRSAGGALVELGHVGDPVEGSDSSLIRTLIANGYVPVVASIGTTIDGELLNVNADTLAAHLAATLRADRLIIAGGTAGVLDSTGRSIAELDLATLDQLVADGTATAGMIAKLQSCARAIRGGVLEALIVDGRSDGMIADAVAGMVDGAGTRISVAKAARS